MTFEEFRKKLLSFIGNKLFDKVILSIDDIKNSYSFEIILTNNSFITIYNYIIFSRTKNPDIEISVYSNNFYNFELSGWYSFDEFINLIS